MDNDILNLEEAIDFLGISEKTLIKSLREEHIPARKLGREWRFSREALINWLASGDSLNYINQSEKYIVSEDIKGESLSLLNKIGETLNIVKESDLNIKSVLKNLKKDIKIPDNAALRISYKEQRDIEKLEFKVFWNMGED